MARKADEEDDGDDDYYDNQVRSARWPAWPRANKRPRGHLLLGEPLCSPSGHFPTVQLVGHFVVLSAGGPLVAQLAAIVHYD